MAVVITTNSHPRDVIEAWELSESERAQFDYLDWEAIERGDGLAAFFRYRGDLYSLGEFLTTSRDFGGPRFDEFRAWDGYMPDTYWSGMLVRYAEDFERVIVARFYLTEE